MQCSALRKNGHVCIKGLLSISFIHLSQIHHLFSGRPCKIVDMSTSKTGKHGHAKVHLVAIDVCSLLLLITRTLYLKPIITLRSSLERSWSVHITHTHHIHLFIIILIYRKISVLPPTTWTFPMSNVMNTNLSVTCT